MEIALPDARYICPCCGYRTLETPIGDFDDCPVCYWEADAVQSFDPSLEGGPSRTSLDQCRVNYCTLGVTELRLLQSVRAPLPDEVPKRAPMLLPLGWKAMQTLIECFTDHARKDLEPLTQLPEPFYGEKDSEIQAQVLERYAHDERERGAIVERIGPMFNGVRGVLCHHNPMQFGIELPVDYKMYDTQVQGILARRPEVHSPQQVLHTVHEEFGRWFVPEIVGEMQRYSSIAQDVWDLYQTWG